MAVSLEIDLKGKRALVSGVSIGIAPGFVDTSAGSDCTALMRDGGVYGG